MVNSPKPRRPRRRSIEQKRDTEMKITTLAELMTSSRSHSLRLWSSVATVIRPGMIVGVGGHGFEALVGDAQKALAVGRGGDRRMRTIVVDDLVGYLVAIRETSETYGKASSAWVNGRADPSGGFSIGPTLTWWETPGRSA
jgi:hypothetical protein